MSREEESVPQWERPIPRDASDQDRRENALLHLGRILGAAMILEQRLAPASPLVEQTLQELIAAAKRAATWLGATLWADEYQAEKES